MFTDKLVAKIPSTASGKVTAIKFNADDIAPVGHVLLMIETDAAQEQAAVPDHSAHKDKKETAKPTAQKAEPGPGN